MQDVRGYQPPAPLVVIVGNFGSGKTEVSVNLALALVGDGPVRIVDLDIVNPYFRCREAREEMEARGIEVIYPKGEFHSADLPIVLPEIKGAVSVGAGHTILDVGGDDVGARVLSSLAPAIQARPHALLQVVNSRRPFTDSLEGCRKMKREIEAASRLRITGVISNTHLMEETDEETIREGIRLAGEVARAEGIALEFATVDERLMPAFLGEEPPCPLLPIVRRMLPPWAMTRRDRTDHAGWLLEEA